MSEQKGKELTVEKAKNAALDMLSYSAKTEKQIREKLAEKGFGEAQIDETVVYLRKMKYVDDIAFAISYIEAARAKGRGRMRIARELAEKGVAQFDIEDAFYGFEKRCGDEGTELEPERERALSEALKLVNGKVIDGKLIAKAGRKLKSLGYDSDSIYYAVGRLMKSGETEENV